MTPFAKLILGLALTVSSAEFVAKITLAEKGEQIDLKWNEADDKYALATSFVQTHTGQLEGVSCKVGETECFTNVLVTHMSKFEEVNGELPVLNLGAAYDAPEPFEDMPEEHVEVAETQE